MPEGCGVNRAGVFCGAMLGTGNVVAPSAGASTVTANDWVTTLLVTLLLTVTVMVATPEVLATGTKLSVPALLGLA